jgi:hypothetical protein
MSTLGKAPRLISYHYCTMVRVVDRVVPGLLIPVDYA